MQKSNEVDAGINPLESLKKKKDRWYIFVLEYIKDFNGRRAAEAVGYKGAHVRRRAVELLDKPEIQGAIAWAIKERSERTKIDADDVLIRLGAMLDADPCDIIDRDTGCYINIHDWPLVWRQMLTAADVQELYAGAGDDKKEIGRIVKYKFIDKLKALEMTGKHVDVNAFKERREITGKDGKPLIPESIKIIYE